MGLTVAMTDPRADRLLRPRVGVEEAGAIVRDAYGLRAEVRELGSNQDRNFLITPEADGPDAGRLLLKIDNEAFGDEQIEALNAALERLAASGLSVPTPVRSPDGAALVHVPLPDGRTVRARLLRFLEGESLVDDGRLGPAAVSGMGRLAGLVAARLAEVRDPALERDLQWDLRNAAAVVEAYAPEIPEPQRRDRVLAAAREAWATVQRLAERLPVQPIHGDITDDNVVGPRDALGRVVPESIIDFGDLATGWRVAEIAVTVSSLLHHLDDRPALAMPAVRAFHELVPLTDAEQEALWPLVVLRGAVLVASGAGQVAAEADNEYARERMEHEWRIFRTACSIEPPLAEAMVRAALAGPQAAETEAAARADSAFRPLVPVLAERGWRYARLDAASPLLHRGRWLEPDAEERIAREASADGRFAVFAYGEHRLTRSAAPGELPENASLELELAVPGDGAELVAPFDGEADGSVPGAALLRGALGELRVLGLDSAAHGPLSAGDPLGRAPGGALLRIRWLRPGVTDAPRFTDADLLGAWRLLSGDPALLLGVPPVPPADPAAERARREAALASAAERYYEQPPQIERGWRELMADTGGRLLIDLVNNVSAAGHGHPRLADAVHEQLLRLNTNSRFLYRALADYTERLAELAPDPSLSVVMLVNSGSEAIELALQLARAHTGRRDVVALHEAYHGWTIGADAVSTSAYDNPHAEGTRPDWVHLADAVNPYRGRHRGPGSGPAYAAEVEALLERMGAAGTPVGAFVCEPIFGNGGGIVPPDGYLPTVYEAVRRRGGVCIADEVQIGLGRLGRYRWGVQQQGVVPDVMTVAKALGNAYPIGAVYTTPEIAASLSRQGMFFSSAGGAAASAVAGLAVLDVLRDERLAENAAEVGELLRTGLEELMDRHPLVGAVHGMGLYLGVELVRDRDTLEPARAETEWVCERLLDYGCIVQSTSERRNVLKVKPPLCLSAGHAEHFLRALDAVLTELAARTGDETE